MPLTLWSECPSRAFAGPGPDERIALLPVGAIEQHGPHLPTGTDAILASTIALAAAERAEVADIVLLPTQSFGASEEHHDFPGTLWVTPELLIPTLVAIGRGVAASGIRRLVFLNAHGGNVPSLQIVCRRLRVEHGMFAAAAGWMAFGVPDLGPAADRGNDIHAGFLETAAMLHVRPDLVDMTLAENFVTTASEVAKDNEVLRLLGPVATGWTARDLHPSGAAGDASAATAQAGRRIVEHAVGRYARFLDEVARHRPVWETAP